MKKRTLIITLSALIFAAAVTLFPGNISTPQNPTDSVPASAPSQRIDYFASHGWDVHEIACRNVVIPSVFSPAYEEYARIQDKQGLPLREYAGSDAQLYLYEVKNYSPESKNMLAELLVCDDIAVASLVYSEDGGSLRFAVS